MLIFSENDPSVSTAVRYGTWQTMLSQAAIQIQTSKYPRGFLVVVLASEDNEFCNVHNDDYVFTNETGNLKKNITITEWINTEASTTIQAVVVVRDIYYQ